jgi:NADH-quinone oxidoreductase subunit C
LQRPIRVKRPYKGQEIEVDEIIERFEPGFLEVVYHLYSMALKHGPVILRMRTENRTDQVHVPSLTGLYHGAEFQEREVYDLFGIIFDGHPDLRRLLMWEEFTDHPMRKDYQEPDDYQYEPTPHGRLLEKANRHYPPEALRG